MENYPDYPVRKVLNLLALLQTSVELYGKQAAFCRTQEEITYHQFERAVLCVAGSLIHDQGRFVLIHAEDPFLFAAAYFATVITGNIAVLIDVEHCPSGAVLPPIEYTLTDTDILKHLDIPPISYNRIPPQNPETVCTIIYSSGTTSASKGIMLSQKNLCYNVMSGLEKYRFSCEDRLLQLIPYYHAFGLVCDMLAPLLSGSAICIPDSKAQALSQMASFRPTMMNVPPAVAEAFLTLARRTKNLDIFTGGQLRKLLCGGAGLRAETTKALLQWNIKALGCYGVSECSPCISVNRDNYYKAGSAGIPLNCNKVRIAEDGEIIIRGDNVMLGYYGAPELTAQVIVDGEYHTGDLGYLDEDGFLYVSGRKNNIIVFEDGTKCLPEKLEEIILKHPGVQEVIVFARKTSSGLRLCSLVSVPEIERQEEVKKYILSIPTYQPFFSIEFTQKPLPKTNTGKVKRNVWN